MHESECDIPVPEIFCFFTSVPETFSTKKVLEAVPEKMVPKISTGTSTWKIWHQKKAPVSEQISGTVTLCMTVHSPINISQLQWIFEPLKICGRLQSVQST